MSKTSTGETQDPAAVGWHSEVADEFDASYTKDRRFRERFSVWQAVIEQHCPAGGAALDLGCGSGELLFPLALKSANVLGIDGSAEMLAICERKLREQDIQNIRLAKADINELHAMDLGELDIVVASSVLEYLSELESVIDTVSRHLKPGGVFAFSLPNGSSLYRKAEPLLYRLFKRPAYYPYVVNVLTPREIRTLIEQHGFSVTQMDLTSPTAGLSAILRPLGLAIWSDNLAVFTCRKAPVADT